MESNISTFLKKAKKYYLQQKRLVKKYAIISAIIAIFISGLMTMGNRVMWGYLEEPTYNPFYLIVYGLFWEGSFPKALLIFLFLFALLLLLKAYWAFRFDQYDERNFKISDSGVYGTSHPMSEAEKQEILHIDRVENLNGNILGVDIEKNLPMEINPNLPIEKKIGVHKFVCGSTGMRKSRSVSIPDIMQAIKRQESVVVADPKGELYQITSKLAEKHGHEVKVFNLVNPIVTDSCNFLTMVGNDSFMAQTLANVLIANSGDDNAVKGDPFFERGEKAFLAFGILLISCNSSLPPEKKTLGQVYDRLVNAYKYAEEYKGINRTDAEAVRQANFESLNMIAASLPEEHPANRQWAIFLTQREAVRDSIIGGFASRFQLMSDPIIDKMTAFDEIDLVNPGKKPCAYYVIMSDQDTTLNYFAAMFFDLLISGLCRYADQRIERKCKVPVNMILDEFPNIGKIPNISKKINTIRSRDIHVTIMAQLIGQLMDNYPGHEWEALVDACDINVMLGLNEVETNGAWWEKKTGTMTVDVDSERAGKSKLKPINIVTEYNESIGRGKRAVFNADEIDHMERDRALLFISGYNVLQVKKFDYIDHPYAKELEEIMPIEHRPDWWDAVKGQAWFEEQRKSIEEICSELQKEREKKKREPKTEQERPPKEESAQQEEDVFGTAKRFAMDMLGRVEAVYKAATAEPETKEKDANDIPLKDRVMTEEEKAKSILDLLAEADPETIQKLREAGILAGEKPEKQDVEKSVEAEEPPTMEMSEMTEEEPLPFTDEEEEYSDEAIGTPMEDVDIDDYWDQIDKF